MDKINLHRKTLTDVLRYASGLIITISGFGLLALYLILVGDMPKIVKLSSLIFLLQLTVLIRLLTVDLLFGRIFEHYLLSRRTLAIVRRGRATRYVKRECIVEYRPNSMTFRLRNGTAFDFRCCDSPNSRSRLTEELITLWHGELEYKGAREALRLAHFPPRWIGAIAAGLLVVALAAMTYAGMVENGFLLKCSLAGLFMLALFYVAWGACSARRVTWPLGGGDETAHDMVGLAPQSTGRSVTILRFPDKCPRHMPALVSYTALFLLSAVTIPICRYLMYIPQDARRDVSVATFAIAGILFTIYIARRCYETLIRGDLFTTVLLSPKTLALVRPRKPVRYLKHAEIVAFEPNAEQLVLTDGTKIDVGPVEEHGNLPGLMEVLWRYWWDYVPEERRKGPDLGLGIGWMKGAVVLGLAGLGIAIAANGDDAEREWMAGMGVALCLWATGYYFYALVKKNRDFRISLRRENYIDLT